MTDHTLDDSGRSGGRVADSDDGTNRQHTSADVAPELFEDPLGDR
jgi:hypothetical protein